MEGQVIPLEFDEDEQMVETPQSSQSSSAVLEALYEPEDLSLGEYIHVSYITDSQRYMEEDEYQPREGFVVAIGSQLEDIRIRLDDGTVSGICPPQLHYFGMSRGYSYFIHKRSP